MKSCTNNPYEPKLGIRAALNTQIQLLVFCFFLFTLHDDERRTAWSVSINLIGCKHRGPTILLFKTSA